LGIVMLVSTNLAANVVPELSRRAVDGIHAKAPPESLRQVALWMVVAALLGAAFRTASRVLILSAARDAELSFRLAIYRALTGLDAPFFSRHPPGDLMSRATNDLTQVRLLLGPALLNAVNTVVAYVTVIPLMLRIDVKLTLVAFVVYPPAILLLWRYGPLVYQRNRVQQEALGTLSNVVQENLSAVALVRAYAVEHEQIRRFRRHNQGFLRANLSLAWLGSCIYRVAASLSSLGTLAVVVLGAGDCMRGRLSLGDVVALVEYMALLAGPTSAFGWMHTLWQRGTSSLRRLEDVLGAAPVLVGGARELACGPVAIEARGLSVSLGAARVLEGVTFSLSPGRSLGIVGSIGSGKSTLARALLRLVPLADGELCFDGRPAADYSLASLYRLFGYVPQEPSLMAKSIYDNVAFGAPAAGREAVLAALEQAGMLAEAERFDQGVQTVIGERGATLSGGQKQRCALARALLRQAPILLLDDALSAVDTDTEARILEALVRAPAAPRTTVLIAHRVATVAHCDEILLLDAGRVVERGSYAALMDKDGAFARMANQQRLLGKRGHA
jgi:ATP-binding cassette subfamily B protein